MSPIAALHGVLAIAYTGFVVTIFASGALAVAGRADRVFTDRLILGALVVGAASAVVGLGVLLLGRSPSDPLHLLYGALAVVLLPAVRYAARRARPTRLAIALAITAIALVGVLVRLSATG